MDAAELAAVCASPTSPRLARGLLAGDTRRASTAEPLFERTSSGRGTRVSCSPLLNRSRTGATSSTTQVPRVFRHPPHRGRPAALLLVPARHVRGAAPAFAAGDRGGAQPSQKLLRMRARPKILSARITRRRRRRRGLPRRLARIISDVEFPRADGRSSPTAGSISCARCARPTRTPQSSSTPRGRNLRQAAGWSGLPAQRVAPRAGRARRICSKISASATSSSACRMGPRSAGRRPAQPEERLATMPAESIRYHGARNHFSRGCGRAPTSGSPMPCGRARCNDYPLPRPCART